MALSAERRLRLGRLVHAAWFDSRPARSTFEPGDLYHYPSERTLKDFLPFGGRGNDAQEAASKAKVEALLKDKGATLWIQHDIVADAKLKKSPAFYD